MVIWVVFAVMTAAAAFAVLLPLARGRADRPTASEQDVSVYKDQLAEVDRDLERGVIGAAEAGAARTEIARRLLKAARESEIGAMPAGTEASGAPFRRRAAALAAVVVLPAIALGVYTRLGQPDLPDEPLTARREAKLEGQSIDQLVGKVEAHLAANPNDARGWELLAPIYLRTGRAADAAQAWRNAIRIDGPTPRRQMQLGEALMSAAGGVVTAEAREIFEAAKSDPGDAGILSRMYLALALSQDGKLAESAAAWKALIAGAKGDERWVPVAEKELNGVETKLGVPLTPSRVVAAPADAAPRPGPRMGAAPAAGGAAMPGPSAADVDAAASLSAGDRQKMIEQMVARLGERLDSSGGSVEEWSRLMRALAVLGRLDDAKAAAVKARKAYENDEAGRGRIDALAKELGIAS